MTKIINLYAGPSAGKSTTRAGLFHEMKLLGLNVEEVPEYAKDLTWEKRLNTLQCQPYVFGKQLYRIYRLLGQVEYIITDSPLLLSIVYSKEWPQSFKQSVIDIYEQMDNFSEL